MQSEAGEIEMSVTWQQVGTHGTVSIFEWEETETLAKSIRTASQKAESG